MSMLTVICCVELVCKQRAQSWSRGRGRRPTTATLPGCGRLFLHRGDRGKIVVPNTSSSPTEHHSKRAYTKNTPPPKKACSNERLVEPPQRDVRQRKMRTYSLQPNCAEQAGFWPEMKCNAKTVEPIIKDHPDVKVTTPCSRSLFMQKAETEQGPECSSRINPQGS